MRTFTALLPVMVALVCPPVATADPIKITSGHLHFEGPDPVVTFNLTGKNFDFAGQGFHDEGLAVVFPPDVHLATGANADLSTDMFFVANLSTGAVRNSWHFRASPVPMRCVTDIFDTSCSAEEQFSFAGDSSIISSDGRVLHTDHLVGGGLAGASYFSEFFPDHPFSLDYDFTSPTPEPASVLLLGMGFVALVSEMRRRR